VLFLIIIGLVWVFATAFATIMGFILAVIGHVRSENRLRWQEKYGDHQEHEVTDRIAPVDWKKDLEGWDGGYEWEVEEF
jgi:hypothetical protein